MLGQHHRLGLVRRFLDARRFARRSPEREEAERLLSMLELAGYRHTLANELPYGVQKRLELARALLASPKLLLLDEPAAGLNADERKELRRFLDRHVPVHVAILLVEHDMDFVGELCDRVIVLNSGSKIVEGTPRDTRVMAAYLGDSADDRADHAA